MDKRKSKELLIRAVCVIAAFALWLYVVNVENPRTDQRLTSVPVRLENIDLLSDNGLTVYPPNSEYTVNLSLRGPYNAVITAAKSEFELVADLKGWHYPPEGGRKIPVAIKGAPKNIEIINAENLYINVNLDKIVTRNVPVKPEIALEKKPDFHELQTVVQPATVSVTGPNEAVKDVEYVSLSHTAKDVDRDVSEVGKPLTAYNSAKRPVANVKIYPDTADLYVSIRKVKSVGINVTKKGKEEINYKYSFGQVIPEKVDIAIDTTIVTQDISNLEAEVDVTGKTTTQNVEAKIKPIKGVELIGASGTVSVRLIVDRIISKPVNMEVKVNNPPGADFTYNPEKPLVSVSLSGAENLVNLFPNESFQASIDLKDLKEGEHEVKVYFRAPEGVTITPATDKIKVTITKKAVTTTAPTPTPTPTPTSTGQQ